MYICDTVMGKRSLGYYGLGVDVSWRLSKATE
jgi:hypothetical protein